MSNHGLTADNMMQQFPIALQKDPKTVALGQAIAKVMESRQDEIDSLRIYTRIDELPEWLLEETDKVAHRDYSTGFYYPEHKVQQSTDRSAYFRAWLVVGEVLSWSPEDGGRVTIMSRNKIEAGQEVEFVLPGAAPFAYTVPAGGFRDADGHWVEAINNPAHVFSMPCPQEVPVNAAIRSRTKKPTLKAE